MRGSFFFIKKFKKFRIVKFHDHIWYQHEECIKMSTNKPMFGLVVLEIACDIVIKSDIPGPLKPVVCMKRIKIMYPHSYP